MNMRLKAFIAGVVGVSALTGTAVTGQAAPVAQKSQCAVAQSIESIIDDSGSMGGTDPDKFRVTLQELLFTEAENSGKIEGAVEFGTDATTLFKPSPLGSGQFKPKDKLDVIRSRINADDGSTNYDGAFTLGGQDHPNAMARLFLTDGQPDSETNAYLAPRQKTYVIGFGGAIQGSNLAYLQKIAADTGGEVFTVASAFELQLVAGRLNARLNCQPEPKAFRYVFNRKGQTIRKKIAIKSKKTKKLELTVLFDNPSASVDLAGITVKRGKKLLRTTSKGKKFKKLKKKHKGLKKLKVKTVGKGTTFRRYRITGLKKGKLTFGVKLKKLPTGLQTFGGKNKLPPGVQINAASQFSLSNKK